MQTAEQVKNRRHRRIKMFKDRLGAKCFICGYNKNYASLDFHHLKEKKFPINTVGMERKIQEIENEVLKCILLCRNCHNDIHNLSLSRYPNKTKKKILALSSFYVKHF